LAPEISARVRPRTHTVSTTFSVLGGAVDYFRHSGTDGESDLYENTRPTEETGYLTRPPPTHVSRASISCRTFSVFLFDLSQDIGERNDLSSVRQDLVKELRQKFVDWEKDVDSEFKLRTKPTQ
jgi:hypothetical protein